MSVHKLGIFLLMMPGACAWSQARTGNAAPTHGLEVFGGYSYLLSRVNSVGSSDLPSGSGFNAGLDVRLYRPLSLVGEISVFPLSCNCPAASRPNEKTFLLGPQYSFPVPESSKIAPFAGLLIGGSTYSNYSSRDGYVYDNNGSFAFNINGGLDYWLTPHVAVRGVGGYVHSTLTGSAGHQGYGRGQFDVDLVYHF